MERETSDMLRSCSRRWVNDLGAVSSDTGSPTRHASTHGSSHTRGTAAGDKTHELLERLGKTSGRVSQQHQTFKMDGHIARRPLGRGELRGTQAASVRACHEHHTRRDGAGARVDRPRMARGPRTFQQLLKRALPRARARRSSSPSERATRSGRAGLDPVVRRARPPTSRRFPGRSRSPTRPLQGLCRAHRVPPRSAAPRPTTRRRRPP